MLIKTIPHFHPENLDRFLTEYNLVERENAYCLLALIILILLCVVNFF